MAGEASSGQRDQLGEEDAELHEPCIPTLSILLLQFGWRECLHPLRAEGCCLSHSLQPALGLKSSLPNSYKRSCFFFLSTHLLGIFDTQLTNDKNHQQTERHSGVSCLSNRRMRPTQKEKLISSKRGASRHTHTHTHTPLWNIGSSPGQRGPTLGGWAPIRGPTGGPENRREVGRCSQRNGAGLVACRIGAWGD